MSSTKTQVAAATNISSSNPTQQQKDFNCEDTVARQNRRGNMKSKHLTRSHAMRETTSPPRTPTPRTSESSTSQVPPNGQQIHHQQHIDFYENNNKLHKQSSAIRGNSPIIDTPTVIVTSQHKQQQQHHTNVALCNDIEFPKLTPPKSKAAHASNISGGGTINSNTHSRSECSGSNTNNKILSIDLKLSNDIGSGGNAGSCSSNESQIHFNNNNSSNNNNNNNSNNNNSSNNNSNMGINVDITNKNGFAPQSYNASNALQQALNVTDNSTQPQTATTTPSTIGSGTAASLVKPVATSCSTYNTSINCHIHSVDINQQQPSLSIYDKDQRCPRNDSQNSNVSNEDFHYESHGQHQQLHQPHHHQRSIGSGGNLGGSGKKHRTNSNSKGSKPRLKNIGNNGGGGGSITNAGISSGVMTSSSIEGSLNSSNTSGFISRVFTNSENSSEQYTDYGGTDLLSFFKETLNKTIKDRQFLLKVEKDLIEFVQEGSRGEMRFPQASSYNRMLIHRTAAFFGMEHNVDTETQQCVIVAPTKNTRIPDIRFKSLVVQIRDDSRKSILKRDTHSFDEARQSSYLCPDRGGMLDRKAKSFEEREEDYDRARSRIFNRTQNESGSTDTDDNYISWTNSVDQQSQQLQLSRARSVGKMLKIQNSDGRGGTPSSKCNNYTNCSGHSQFSTPLQRGESTNSNKSGSSIGNGGRIFTKQDSLGSNRLSPSTSSAVYPFDQSSLSPNESVITTIADGGTSPGSYISNQTANNHQQHPSTNPNENNLNPSQLESSASSKTAFVCETLSESSTQTVNIADDDNLPGMNIEAGYDEGTIVRGDECDNRSSSCLSITTTTSTKNFDRIEVQKFKNQATSPNIPQSVKEDISKCEQSSQTNIAAPTQQASNIHRETPHSSRSTPFSNIDTLAKSSSEEPKASTVSTTTTMYQSYQAADGSTVFHATNASNSSNPYCTTTYQQAPDGSIYAVPQGMVYAYPQVEGELQGYIMPIFDHGQQRGETIIQPGTQTIYPTGGATTMVPVAAYPTAQFATNGTSIYPGQVIYSSDPNSGAQIAAAAAATPTGQLQQIPMTSYPIGYSYPYNGYWGQTMTYYVPQQTVPPTPLLTAPTAPVIHPQSHSIVSSINNVAGGVNTSGQSVGNLTAGPSTNSSLNPPNTNISSGTSVTSGFQKQDSNAGTNDECAATSAIRSSGGSTYYGTGRIKRSTQSHYSTGGVGNSHQMLTATTIQNGVSTGTYQFAPTLALQASTTSATGTATSDANGNSITPSGTTMYTFHQPATIFPANIFPYASNSANTSSNGQHTAANVTGHATIIQSSTNPQAAALTATMVPNHVHNTGSIHAPNQTNTVITPFYTTTHHASHHGGVHTHTMHAPGSAGLPILDSTTLNSTMQINTGKFCSNNTNNTTSQSAPSTPHSLTPSVNLQRNISVFATPPIMNNNGSGVMYNTTNVGTNNTGSNYQYYAEQPHQTYTVNNSNPQTYATTSNTFEKRISSSNSLSGNGKKSLTYQSSNQSRQNSAISGNVYQAKPNSLLGGTSSETRTSSASNCYSNARPHSTKRNEKPQTPLLSAPSNFSGASSGSYQPAVSATDIITGTAAAPVMSTSKSSIRLNAAAAAFRQKGTNNSGIEYRRTPVSQRNSPSTNASSHDNSNNNSPNSLLNPSNGNANTPLGTGCYTPSYMINSQTGVIGEAQQYTTVPHAAAPPPPSLYITTRGAAHIPPHLQTATSAVQQQTTTAVLGAAEMANVAAATVTHHQPLLGHYNAAASGLYFKYGHTYFAHPSVALPNSRRSPSTDVRPPMPQMAGMYPTVMIPAQPRHQARHPNPNYKGTRPR